MRGGGMALLVWLRRRLDTVPYQRRLLLSFVGLTSLLLVLAFGILTALVTGMIAQSESKHLGQLLAAVNADLESRLSDINSRGFDIVIDTAIRENLNRKGDIAVARARTKVESILKIKLISSNYLRSIMIIDTSLHLFSPSVSLVLPTGFVLTDSQVYRDAAQKQGSLVWLSENDLYDRYAPDSMYRPDTNIHAAAVIMDYSHRKLLGLMVLSLNQRYFNSITYPDELLSDSRLYLVSPDKKRIFGVAGDDGGLTGHDLTLLPLTGEGAEVIDQNRLLVARPNRAIGWYLVCVTQLTALHESVTEITATLLLVLAATLALGVLFSQRLAVSGSRGIAELIRGMERVEREDFDGEVPVIRQDELGRITQAFNHMVRQIRELIVTEYREKLLMQQAQFKALQSQIRPHFLMNTLDMLHWKLLENGQEELSETVVALSHLMQYSMASGQWRVTLAMEMQNLREYLAVHVSIRGCDIRLEAQVEAAAQIALPRQTLQPLAENAVLHGFAGRERGNVLTVMGAYTPDGEGYILSIADNGAGMPAELCGEINARLTALAPDKAESRHIGLANVAARLSYLYAGATIAVEGEYGCAVRVVLTIPHVREVNEG